MDNTNIEIPIHRGPLSNTLFSKGVVICHMMMMMFAQSVFHSNFIETICSGVILAYFND